MRKNATLVYVNVKTQRQLNKLRFDDGRVIVILFGTEELPAIIGKPFINYIFVSDEYHVEVISGCRVYADDYAHVEVGRDSVIILNDHASCNVYGKSFISGRGNCIVNLYTDEAMVYKGERTRVYRKGGKPDGL